MTCRCQYLKLSNIFLLGVKIFLIRHGQTTGDIEDRYGGDYDDSLTKNGFRQAKKLARQLTGKHLQVVFHSPKIRAQQTATVVAKRLKIKKIQVHDLRERNHYGILTGMTKSDAIQKYPEEVQKLKTEGIHARVTRAETYETFTTRITSVMNTIVKEHYDCIALVSHGGFIRGFMREIAKAGELSVLGDCAVIELEYTAGVYTVVSLDAVQ